MSKPIAERPGAGPDAAGGQQISKEITLTAAKAVTEASTPFLRRLAEWRRQSLENAGRRVVGTGPP